MSLLCYQREMVATLPYLHPIHRVSYSQPSVACSCRAGWSSYGSLGITHTRLVHTHTLAHTLYTAARTVATTSCRDRVCISNLCVGYVGTTR